METKQTAVGYIVKELTEFGFFSDSKMIKCDLVIKQAKKMEKQQIIDAYKEAITNGFYDEDAEQYYNETFKNK